jgi:hypothetical protein
MEGFLSGNSVRWNWGEFFLPFALNAGKEEKKWSELCWEANMK